MLKDFVRERLMAAADEILGIFERTIASYEEQLCRARDESERHRRQLEAVCTPPDVAQQHEPPDRKEKEEPPEPFLSLKQEEEEASISKFYVLAEGDKDEAPWLSRPGGCSPGGGPQADNLFAPLSDGDDAQRLLKDHLLAEGNPDDTDRDLTSESEDDGSTSLMDQSASTPGNAERSTTEENKAPPQKGKKKKRRPHECLRSEMKEARNKGKAYVNTRGIPIPEKNLVPLSRHLCRHKCAENVSEEERQVIFRNFWDMGNFDLQNAFICASVKLVNIQRRRPQHQQRAAGESKNRTYSRIYSFTTSQSGYVEVCKTFFLTTLCVSNGRVYRALLKQVEKGQDLPSPDGRGKHDNRKRISHESVQAIKDHIYSFAEYESHDTQRERKFPWPGLTVAQMHRLYKEQCRKNGKEPEKEWVYRRIFLTEFQSPYKDACTH
ncbi:uncharacterized protein LOC109525301 [Hippocampus comes]|uniref:uncharacterized protein LOC109525301 n=1 Tax=Hippocampus comes TaxID=109280 RepID=UPI00094E28AE|nr:PREDICTED: uncharacterized protein LOC109525301 [Hippocampus comes]